MSNTNGGSLTLVPSGGLANRMRAVVSAYDLCLQTGAELTVYWYCDWALNAPFHSIFEPVSGLPQITVRDARGLDFLLYDRPRRRNLWLPKLARAILFARHIDEWTVTPRKHQGFDFTEWQRGHKCWMSCYQEFGEVPVELYARLFTPVAEIREKVEAYKAQFAPHTIGMHIRRTDHAEAISQSPTSLFLDAAQKELAMHPDLKVYLATDNEEVKAEMREALGPRLITPTVEAARSSVSGIRDGLVDMYTLAATETIYGSAGSSFSPAAARIGGKRLEILHV